MSKELVSGEYCYAGNPEDKNKRIWLGCFSGFHLCVYKNFEDKFKNKEYYETATWDTCTPIEDEPEYTYPMWFKRKTGAICRFDALNVAVCVREGRHPDIKLGVQVMDCYPHTDKEWTQVPEPKTKQTKIVYEWIVQFDKTCTPYILSSVLTEEEAKEELKDFILYKKTGREFEVEV